MKAKDVSIPNTEWLTLLEGAAYVRMSYARFTEAAKRGEFPTHPTPGTKPGSRKGKKVRKSDLDHWMMSGLESD